MDKALGPALMLVGEDEEVIPVWGPRNFQNGEIYIYMIKYSEKEKKYAWRILWENKS